MYPDSLSQCPVCEKNVELQTILGKSHFIDQMSSVPSLDALSKRVMQSSTEKNSDKCKKYDHHDERDDDRTIFIGKSVPEYETVLGGWLIELNCDEMPVQSYQLFLNKKHHIGRNRDNDIVLISSSKSISRYHCVIEYKNPHFIIHDRNSANGTIVNDKRITTQILTDKNLIVLGDQQYWIKYL